MFHPRSNWGYTTGRPDRMSHRKWRESKQQPSRSRSGNQLSCCLVSLDFLCDILSGGPVIKTAVVPAVSTQSWLKSSLEALRMEGASSDDGECPSSMFMGDFLRVDVGATRSEEQLAMKRKIYG